ncbi:dehydrogenase [Actinocatenispora thailandica]|uniref:Dehydrogenase n=1 Tax=Actinocatenispora thailandica TaxID=227318 RepID=A0A7R7DR29_9ACTN|nr:Gfo/Idh/MocA family oxidoreductase [Actinocatenispora thailandica]BCJ36283.1 dehydrogenase [Actinocatenispora thailandica]
MTTPAGSGRPDPAARDAGSRPLTAAVVGLGYGRNHVAEILRLGGHVRLAGVVDPIEPSADPRLAGSPLRDEILAVPHHASLDELFAHEVPDIVAIATPIHTHHALVRRALAAGAHVLLEKPPTATLAEHADLVEAAAVAQRAVQVGFQARGGHGLRAARDAIVSGRIGEVTRIGAVGTWTRDRAYYRRAAWAGRRTLDGHAVMDGVLTNPLAHAVDAALALAGALRAADVGDVVVDPWHAHDIEADDTSAVRASTTAGVAVAAGLTLCASREEAAPVVIAHGTQGSLRLRYSTDRLALIRDGEVAESAHRRDSLLRNLVDHIRYATPLIAPLAETGAFARVLEAVRTGPAPGAIPARHVEWTGSGARARPVVPDVERWCAEVARTGRTFTELGAPWTRGPAQPTDRSG